MEGTTAGAIEGAQGTAGLRNQLATWRLTHSKMLLVGWGWGWGQPLLAVCFFSLHGRPQNRCLRPPSLKNLMKVIQSHTTTSSLHYTGPVQAPFFLGHCCNARRCSTRACGRTAAAVRPHTLSPPTRRATVERTRAYMRTAHAGTQAHAR